MQIPKHLSLLFEAAERGDEAAISRLKEVDLFVRDTDLHVFNEANEKTGLPDIRAKADNIVNQLMEEARLASAVRQHLNDECGTFVAYMIRYVVYRYSEKLRNALSALVKTSIVGSDWRFMLEQSSGDPLTDVQKKALDAYQKAWSHGADIVDNTRR